ncbi:MAG TPA: glycosyltransferase [Chthonomonadaceae bacterium]|nr:glycosyltransferase [Chthonomonadaceae bacterium]
MSPGKPSLVSIIIPCYNQGPLLAEAIESALAQTYPQIEVIVVDDGSTDNTSLIARRYRDRIHYLYQPNAGLSAARNAGLAIARGVYVNFLDSDDRLLPDKIAQQVPLLDEDPALGLVYCRHFLTDAQGIRRPAEALEAHRGEVYHALRRGNFLAVHTALVRRACVEEAGGFDPKLRSLEDWNLWLRIARRYRFDFVDAPLVEYRDLGDSMSKNHLRMAKSCLQVLKLHAQDHPGCAACREADAYLRTWLRLGQAPRLYRGAARHLRRGHWREAAAWLSAAMGLYPTYLIDPKRWLRGYRKAAQNSAYSLLLKDDSLGS